MSLFRKTSLDFVSKSLPTNASDVSRCLSDHGTSLYACRKGSFTLEAAVVLPLTAAFFVFLLFIFRVLQIQTAVQSALAYAGRKTAVSAVLDMGELADFATAEALFQKEIQENNFIAKYVRGGTHGISLLGSDFSGEEIELCADYQLVFPLSFFEVKGIGLKQTVHCRKWTGKPGGDVQDSERYVYVTESGSVYHMSRECNYVRPSIKTVLPLEIKSLRNQDGEKYKVCEQCAEKSKETLVYYITSYGNRYHTDISCSGLKRTLIRIPASEKGSRRGCKKCVGEEEV